MEKNHYLPKVYLNDLGHGKKENSFPMKFCKSVNSFSWFSELEIGLENNQIDLVVHSLKDLPSTLPENMVIGAIMERLDPRDVVIMKKKVTKDDDPMKKDDQKEPKELSDLRKGSILGTSAVRRGAQLRAAFPDLGIIGLDVFDDGYLTIILS